MLHRGTAVTVNHSNTQHVSISLEERPTRPPPPKPRAGNTGAFFSEHGRTQFSFSVVALTSFGGDSSILMCPAVEEASACFGSGTEGKKVIWAEWVGRNMEVNESRGSRGHLAG